MEAPIPSLKCLHRFLRWLIMALILLHYPTQAYPQQQARAEAENLSAYKLKKTPSLRYKEPYEHFPIGKVLEWCLHPKKSRRIQAYIGLGYAEIVFSEILHRIPFLMMDRNATTIMEDLISWASHSPQHLMWILSCTDICSMSCHPLGYRRILQLIALMKSEEERDIFILAFSNNVYATSVNEFGHSVMQALLMEFDGKKLQPITSELADSIGELSLDAYGCLVIRTARENDLLPSTLPSRAASHVDTAYLFASINFKRRRVL